MTGCDVLEKLMEYFGVNRAVIALSIARLADALGNSILFIIIPLYIAKLPHDYFDLPVPVMVGILISVYGFVVALFQPIMGALADYLGRRKILIQVGLGLIAVCTLTFIFASKYLDLLILRTLQGVAVAITVPAALSLMSAITKKETRGSAMGVYSTFRMIGFVLGPMIGGFLLDHFGFDAAFYTGTGAILLAMLMIQIWVSDVRVKFENNKKPKIKIIDKDLISPGILSAGTATFLMAAAFSMVTTLENEFNAKLGISAFGFSFAFSTLMVGRLILQVPLGKLSDKIGRKPLVLGGLILMASATFFLGEVTTLTQLVLVRLGQGAAAAAIAAPAFAIAADLSTSGGEGRQMSIITTGFGLGLAVGPLIAGLLAVIFFELPFITLGILTLGGAVLVYYYLPETIEGEKVIFDNRG